MYILSNEEICSFLPYYSLDDMYDHINDAIVNVFESIIFILMRSLSWDLIMKLKKYHALDRLNMENLKKIKKYVFST